MFIKIYSKDMFLKATIWGKMCIARIINKWLVPRYKENPSKQGSAGKSWITASPDPWKSWFVAFADLHDVNTPMWPISSHQCEVMKCRDRKRWAQLVLMSLVWAASSQNPVRKEEPPKGKTYKRLEKTYKVIKEKTCMNNKYEKILNHVTKKSNANENHTKILFHMLWMDSF